MNNSLLFRYMVFTGCKKKVDLICFVCLFVVLSLYKITCKLCRVSPLDEPFVALGTNTCNKYVYKSYLSSVI